MVSDESAGYFFYPLWKDMLVLWGPEDANFPLFHLFKQWKCLFFLFPMNTCFYSPIVIAFPLYPVCDI